MYEDADVAVSSVTKYGYVTGPAKTGHVCTNYTCHITDHMYLGAGIEYLYSASCVYIIFIAN